MCKKLIYLGSFVLALSLVLSSVANAALPGCIGWYKFDGDYLDSSGLNNHGIPGGTPTFVAGKIGSAALYLNGSSYVILDAIADDIPKVNNFSVMVWIKSTQTGSNHVVIGANYSCSSHDFIWGLSNNVMLVEADTINNYPPIINDNQWHHIAYTRALTTAYLYTDGVLIGTETPTGGDLSRHDMWSVGQEWDGCGHTSPSDFYAGAVDDLQFYNRLLTIEEVQQVMKGAPPATAMNPSPADKAIDVPRDVVLSWTPGIFADKHNVYFGTNFNDVNTASITNPRGVLASSNQAATTYDPAGLLEFNKTYYWRVDEVNAPPTSNTIFKGDTWQFTVEPFAYPIAGANIIATASSQFSANTKPENTINGSGLDNNDLHSTEEAGVWVSSMTGAQPTWIQYEFDRVYKLHQMWVWNHNTSLEPIVGFGIKEAVIEYSIDGANWTALGTTAQFARAPGTPGYAHNTTVDLSGVVAKYVKITANTNWGGVLPQYGLSEVRFYYVPVVAREPNPASGATDVGVDNVTLSWRAGREATKHNVYLSDSQQAVIDGTAAVTTVSQASYGPVSFDLGKTYYWRVDEVNEAETPAIWQGDVLNFSTQKYLVVDDFEDYNDFEPYRIFDTWIDGWADPANGSQVGYAEPPFAEKRIVHSGKQSMPLHYDNSTTASYSEATVNVANLAIGRDWTKYGIKTLTLWFYGDPNNSVTERMYVKLSGSKVAYDGDAGNIARTAWQPWNIELSSFGVNLRNVTELKIGFERSGAVGGKGKVYFDDIRLYPYSRQLITPVAPSNIGLAGYWQFDGNLSDSSGKGRHGTGVGNPTFAAGKVGQAVNLTGSNYVVITGYKGILGGGAFSIAAWVKTQGNGTMVNWGTQSGGQRVDFRLDQGRLRVEHGNGNLQGNTALADGQWHHVALTVSENTPISYPNVKLYLDGYDDSQMTTDPDTFNIVANVDVNIGRRGTNNDRLFPGSLDEVRIYERVLSQEEVAGLAGRTKPFDKPF